ncbi:SCO family protein [Commensalibacter oyaizuii]|uniref:SCO family protein n=1 Tax=Commensalibacter oyaizuii TaxID=3043873 RepID=A0ABT6Q2Q9_9PROT|nr:SCO family protein [Commensalibacter sp. TBRC 16381]MDI2091408.1 SCO family protein [Commensalibacter sp. TBRC 16381]
MTEKKKLPLWIFFVIALIIALAGGYAAIHYTVKSTQVAPQQSNTIGGSFQLLSPSGNVVNDGIFRGKWMLMYFGASRCLHNECSKNLIKMGKVIELLGNKASKLSPIFISFDIQYDTPSRLMLYMKPFNHKILALTGGELAIRDISILYHIPLNKIKAGEKTELIVPYNQFIVMDPQGIYNSSIPTEDSAEQIAQKLDKII